MIRNVCSQFSYNDYMTAYRDAAVVLWGEAGAFVHDSYARHRERIFPELPADPAIVIGITAYGHCIGLTRGDWNAGPRITIASNTFKVGHRHVDDVMVHEMLHAWLTVTGRRTEHDSDDWYAMIRKLSPTVLGHDLDIRRGAQRKSVREPNPNHGQVRPDGTRDARKTIVRKVPIPGAVAHADIARWPYPFRPADYDQGRVIDCPSY